MDDIIIFCAKYVVFLVALMWLVVLIRIDPKKRRQFIATTVVAGIVALLVSLLAGKLYYDPRPFVSGHVVPLIKHAADNGFPSDHALFTMTLTAVSYFFSRKLAWIMLVLTIIVGMARVTAHVHSPVDIIGAWVIGIVSALVVYWLVARTARRGVDSAKLNRAD